jgi:uncharacterized protein YegJ (DUF2314 family)
MATDKTVPFESEDAEMAAAIRAAKDSFAEFLAALRQPRAGQVSFLVKAAFVEGEHVEHIWLADLELLPNRLRGVVANEPSIESLKFKQQVEIDPSQLSDWMYIENGCLVGGFTTRLIRKRMNPQERAALDANSPYTF